MTSLPTCLLLLSALPLLSYPQGADADANREEYATPNYLLNSLIDSLEGRDLFRAYCAGCHGADARGGGPAASLLKSKPPDLTQIAARRGGMFSLAEVETIISGEEIAPATHGKREMPIWGPILGQIQRDQNLGKIRIRNLARYLESLQVKPPTAHPKASPEGNGGEITCGAPLT